jgi:opacity protein-like surface antigen
MPWKVDMRTMKALSVLLTAGMWFTLSAADASAQSRLSLEGRVGAAIPTGDLSDGDAGTGLALAAEAMYSFSPILTGYIGVSRDAFSCDDEDFCEDLSSSGLQGGLKFLLAREGSLLPWVRLGLIGQSLDLGDEDTDMSLGFEAGGGLDIDVSPRFAVVPGVHYRSYSPDFDPGDLDVRYFVLSLGGHIHF